MQNLAVAEFLPDITLPSMPDGHSVQLRESGGRTTVLFTVHHARCSGCQDYVNQLGLIAGEFDVWDARLLVLVPASHDEAAHLHGYGKVLADEHGALADPASASVILSDRYGQVFFAIHSGASHDFPSVRDVEEWLKYLGTLCPE
jgi:hypothetical protein